MTISSLLQSHGAVLVRQRKHMVYKFPDGRIFVQPSTPSDSKSGGKNALAALKNFLGLTKHETTVGERRERKPKRRPVNRKRLTLAMSTKIGLQPRQTMADDLKRLYATLPRERSEYRPEMMWLIGQRG